MRAMVAALGARLVVVVVLASLVVVGLAGFGAAAAGAAGPAAAAGPAGSAAGSLVVLGRGAGFERRAGSVAVRGLQRRLGRLGFSPGPVDGLFGPLTEAAVVAFQRARGLVADGLVGAATAAQLAARQPDPADPAGRRPPAGGGRSAGRPPATAAGGGGGVVWRRQGGTAAGRALVAGGGRAGWRLVGLAALAAAGLLGWLLWLARGQLVLAAASPDMVAAGRLPDGGRFDGRLQALSLARRPLGRRRTRLLVADDQRHTALWVELDQLDRLDHQPQPATHTQTTHTQPTNPNNQPAQPNPKPEPPNADSASAQATAAAVPDSRPQPEPEPPNANSASAPPAVPDHGPEPPDADAASASVPPAGGGAAGVRAFGYLCGDRLADRRALEAQAGQLERACRRRGWTLVGLARDNEPAAGRRERPALAYALDQLANRHAELLLVPQLDQLCRSVAELAQLTGQLAGQQSRLVCLQPELDSATNSGQTTLAALTQISNWERQRLAQRTRKGLAAARANRPFNRPTVNDKPELKQHIQQLRNNGLTLQAIADQLNQQNIPTLRGGSEWRPSSVQAAVGYKRPNHTQPPTNHTNN